MLPVEQEACFSTHVSNYPDVACFHLDCFAIKSPFQTCATCDLWLTHTLNSKMEPDNGSRLHNIPTYVPISWLYVIKNFCNYIPHPYHAICFTFVLAKKCILSLFSHPLVDDAIKHGNMGSLPSESSQLSSTSIYPVVNLYITMENHHVKTHYFDWAIFYVANC